MGLGSWRDLRRVEFAANPAQVPFRPYNTNLLHIPPSPRCYDMLRSFSVTCPAGTAHADAVPSIVPAAGDWMVSWTRGIDVSTYET